MLGVQGFGFYPWGCPTYGRSGALFKISRFDMQRILDGNWSPSARVPDGVVTSSRTHLGVRLMHTLIDSGLVGRKAGAHEKEKMSNRPRVKYQLVYLSIRRLKRGLGKPAFVDAIVSAKAFRGGLGSRFSGVGFRI